jgi:hypothetical protein
VNEVKAIDGVRSQAIEHDNDYAPNGGASSHAFSVEVHGMEGSATHVMIAGRWRAGEVTVPVSPLVESRKRPSRHRDRADISR